MYVSMSNIACAPGLRVQSPLGPRKSLIPESVEIPAPVRTTTSGEARHSSTSSLCVPMGAMMAHRTAGAR